MNKAWLLLVVFGVGLVVNPYLACSTKDEPSFTYGEADMKAALLGTWQGSAELGGEAIPFSLTLEQPQSDRSLKTTSPATVDSPSTIRAAWLSTPR